MEHFSLNIKTCCLYVVWESKIEFGQKFFASSKICTHVHLWEVVVRFVETFPDRVLKLSSDKHLKHVWAVLTIAKECPVFQK